MTKENRKRSGRNWLLTGVLVGAGSLLVLPVTASAGPAGEHLRSGPARLQGWGGGQGDGRGHFLGRRGRRGKRGPGHRLERMRKRLGLTPAQVKQIKQLRQSQRSGKTALRLQQRRLRAQMRVAWLAENPDLNKIKELHQKLMNLKQKRAKERFQTRLKLYQILTPAQRKKVQASRGRFGGRFSGRFTRGRRHKRRGHGF